MYVTAVTQKGEIENEIQTIVKLFELGLDMLHLRKPNFNERKMEKLIEEIPSTYYDRIVLHGHYSLTSKYKLKGIHMRKSHRSSSLSNTFKKLLMKLRSPGILITTSFRSLQSLQENNAQFDYVLLSNVFTDNGHYKSDQDSGVNILKKVVEASRQKVVGVVALDADNVKVIEAAGFYGAGLPEQIWEPNGFSIPSVQLLLKL
jgi:thiamine-phosphate pyrophosphorylase